MVPCSSQQAAPSSCFWASANQRSSPCSVCSVASVSLHGTASRWWRWSCSLPPKGNRQPCLVFLSVRWAYSKTLILQLCVLIVFYKAGKLITSLRVTKITVTVVLISRYLPSVSVSGRRRSACWTLSVNWRQFLAVLSSQASWASPKPSPSCCRSLRWCAAAWLPSNCPTRERKSCSDVDGRSNQRWSCWGQEMST